MGAFAVWLEQAPRVCRSHPSTRLRLGYLGCLESVLSVTNPGLPAREGLDSATPITQQVAFSKHYTDQNNSTK
jgi:hypothetical protein